MKTVLLPLIEPDDTEPILSAAVAVARTFDSLIEGFCFKPTYSSPAFFEAAPPSMDETFEESYRERAEELRGRFLEFMQKNDIATVGGNTKPGTTAAQWLDKVRPGYPFVSHRARLFDLVVVAQGSRSGSDHAYGILEAALFESGRPVLVTPPDETAGAGAFGRNVVISWNGSDESVRAIAFAMPFLQRAEKVSVLAVEGGMVPGPDAGEIVDYLAHHGIESEATGARPENKTVGEAILEESGRLGADMLIKGAYTHSRIRQMVFGGPTRHILEHARIPVLMAH